MTGPLQHFQPVIESFSLILLNEMGDRTQLLALALAARYRKPIPLLLGILTATTANHAIAVAAGSLGASWVSSNWLMWLLGATFIGFGLWALIPDRLDSKVQDELQAGSASSDADTSLKVFWATLVPFFFAEMGDKTQLATLALAARYRHPASILLGTTLGMMVADGLAVMLGHRFSEKLPLALIQKLSAALFIIYGVWTVTSGMRG